MRISIVFICLTAVFLAGCRTQIGDFSLISTGTPQYAKMDTAPMIKTVKGSDSRFWLLFIPFGSAPNMKEAIDRCLDAGNGDFMERARLYDFRWSLIIFSYGRFEVQGDVGNSKAETTVR